jgi:hypothetical protein
MAYNGFIGYILHKSETADSLGYLFLGGWKRKGSG